MSVISVSKGYSPKTNSGSLLNVLDAPLLLSSLVLLGLGLVMVASSSVSIAERQLSDPLYYFWRQLSYSVIGLVVAAMVFKIPLKYVKQSGPVLIVMGMILLLMVLVPGLGREVNGSMRWLNLGFTSIQVSEFVKLATIIYLAGYLVRHNEEVRTNLSGFLRPLILIFLFHYY